MTEDASVPERSHNWTPTPGGGWVPVPDPTTLTTAQLRRELATQREFLELQIAALKELMFTRFDASSTAVAAALDSADRAVAKAETATEKRFESVNEFRAQQQQLINTFVPRAEYVSAHEAVLKGLEDLSKQLAATQATIVPRIESDDRMRALTEKLEASTQASGDGLRAQDAQQEARIRDLEARMANVTGSSEGSAARRADEHTTYNNRLIALGVMVSVVVVVVNVVIALVTHHA